MKNEPLQISEIRETELRLELKRLEEHLNFLRRECLQSTRTGDVWKDISSDISSCQRMIRDIKDVLEHATVVKVDLNSTANSVEVGDIVSVDIAYSQDDHETMKLQIDGSTTEEIIGISLASPMGKALFGKTVGEYFVLTKSSDCPIDANGVVQEIIKAKDIADQKQPYVLK